MKDGINFWENFVRQKENSGEIQENLREFKKNWYVEKARKVPEKS